MQFEQIINNLKTRRKSLQITQESLADLSRVGLRTIRQFEAGKGNPTLTTLVKVGEVLGMELNFTVSKRL